MPMDIGLRTQETVLCRHACESEYLVELSLVIGLVGRNCCPIFCSRGHLQYFYMCVVTPALKLLHHLELVYMQNPCKADSGNYHYSELHRIVSIKAAAKLIMLLMTRGSDI